MRFDRFPLRRRSLLALGAIAACAVTTAAAVPAYAGSVGHGGPAARPAAASYASAPISGRTVTGAVYGAAATRAAGSTAIADFLKLHQRMRSQTHGIKGSTPDAKLHMWWGSFPDKNSGTGVIATQSISQTLRLSDRSDILYAPTMTPANNSCIEVVTVHTTRTPQIWAWNWCHKIRPTAVVQVNTSFMQTYTTNLNGLTSYTTKDVQTSADANTWTAYLFNYKTGSWDKLYTSHGQDKTGLSFGWDMFEFYSSTNPATGNTFVCGDLQNAGTQIESSNIAIRTTGTHTWTPANPSNSAWNPSASPDPASYKCPGLQFNIVQNNSAWMVHVAG